LTGHTGPVRVAVFGRVGQRELLATAGQDGTVRLYDLTNPAAPAPLGRTEESHTGLVRVATFGRVDGRDALATAGDDGTIRLYDLTNPAAPVLLGTPFTSLAGIGEVIGFTGVTGGVYIADVGESWLYYTNRPDRLGFGVFSTGPGLVQRVVRTYFGATPIAAVASDRQVELYSSGREGPVRHASIPGEARGLAFGSVGTTRVLAVAGEHGPVRLYDLTNLDAPVLHTELSTGDPLLGVAFGRVANTSVLAVASQDGTVQLYGPIDRDGLVPLASLSTGGGPLPGVAFGHVGPHAVAATVHYGQVRLYDLADPTQPTHRRNNSRRESWRPGASGKPTFWPLASPTGGSGCMTSPIGAGLGRWGDH
jgi:WD40 repeat protein